jgi:4-alpha-glucanotransferase
VDPATDRRVEVSSGFSHVWTDGNDYLLSNEAGFDPLRELGGSWRALQRE